MFGPGFDRCWYSVPGVPGLELSGDLRFRGPGGVRRMRHDRNGRPYVLVRKGEGRQGWASRVMLHRAVMGVLLGREFSPGEMVCHRDDDKRKHLAREPLHRRCE